MALLQRLEFYTVVVYLALVIAVGAFYGRRLKGGVDYFAGGRAVPWWASGISLYMGNFSAWLFTGGAGLIFRTTGSGLLFFFLTQTCAYSLGSLLTARKWRRARVISPVEFTLARFGFSTQMLMTLVYSGTYLASAGIQLYALSNVVNGVLGVPQGASAIVIGAVILCYTISGGLWTVVVTDVVQFVILLAVVVVAAPLSIGLLSEGPSAMLAVIDFALPAVDKPDHTLPFVVAMFLSFTIGVASGQAPRFYCVPDERAARKAGLLAGALFLTTPLLFSIPPLVARAHFGLEGIAPEQAFVQVIQEVFPPGLLGVFLAAMFAASMSAMDSTNNMVAAMLSRDVYMHIRPKATDRDILRVGRVMALVCGLAVIEIALLYIKGRTDNFENMIAVFALTAPPLHVPVVLGLLYRRAPPGAGLVTAVYGITAGALTRYGLEWSTAAQLSFTLTTSAALFLATPWLFEIFRVPEVTPAKQQRLDELFEKLDTPVDVDLEVTGSLEALGRVYRVVGILVLVMTFVVLAMSVSELWQEAPQPGPYLGVAAAMAAFGIWFRAMGRRSSST